MERKYTVNINYFSKIDTIDKAYFLGLLYADGWVSNSKSRGKEFGIGLIDLKILEIFSSYLQSNHPIRPCKKKKQHHSQGYNLSIIRDKLHDDLINLGCILKKSLILKFPNEKQVPCELLSHFIRGYFDGDGCIFVKTYNKASVQIAGTEHFLKGIKFELDNVNISSNIRKAKNIYMLYFSGTNNIKKFYNFIYIEKKNIYFERKFQKFEDLFKEQIIRLSNKFQRSNKKCSVDNCALKHCAKGFCSIHYHTNVTKVKHASFRSNSDENKSL